MAYTTIDDPSAHFQTATYTGNGSQGHAITFDGNSNLQPDWLWGKERTTSGNHNLFDTSRGLNKRLTSDQTDAENTDATTVTAMNTNGFTLGSSSNINENTVSTVAWCWKANGGTTTSVSATGTAHESTMAGTHQANTIAGFSIVTFSTASEDLGDKLITHGIGKKPEWIIIKSRSSGDWYCHHISANTNDSKYIRLNLTNAPSNAGSRNTFDTSNITTTQFAVDHNNIVADNHNHVAYVFAPIQGYSKFGSYTGNGNADGPFVYLGFKPAWVMVKKTSDAHSWYIQYGSTGIDSGDQGSNPVKSSLQANSNSADATENSMDFLSNGFKIRTSGNGHNTSGGTYVYIAFAEHPFVSSEGVPVTAR